MTTKRKLAVFDVDGTIFRSSLTRRLFSYLVNEGIFPARARKEVEPYLRAWLNRKGTYDDYLKKLIDVFIQHIKGKRQKDVRRIARQVVSSEKSQVYRFTRDLIEDLRKKNYFLVAISGSPFEIVRSYNRFLRFSKTYGWVLEVDKSGRYTGKMEHLYSVRQKHILIKRVVKKYGLTMKDSIAVGDTESDLSMFEVVERPIAFNPSSGLYKIAKRKGWEVVVERKDVIYKI
ncbi:HAD family phosphatase [Candidatus Uhrbacteria bacterium]|nr:HAD family phosphatase [Candidatus Uhrbacteria bacterium]